MKKMLIIMTVPLNRNGISSVVMQFLDYINLSKYKVSILCNNYIDDEYKKVIKNKGINFFTFERKKKPLSYFLYLKKLNDDNNYDIVHIHGNSATMILETLALKNKTEIDNLKSKIDIRIQNNFRIKNCSLMHLFFIYLLIRLFKNEYQYNANNCHKQNNHK